MSDLIPKHGGYRKLAAYQLSLIIYDGTVAFTKLYLDKKSRTVDQMVQAARSGKQNIAEASAASGTSKKFELKLTSVARASFEELLLDYQDYLRQNNHPQWSKDHDKAKFIRNLRRKRDAIVAAHESHTSHPSQEAQEAIFAKAVYEIYQPYIEQRNAANAANTLICLINQANFLLDRLLKRQGELFLDQGGFTENLHKQRTKARENKPE
ncbi:MAG: four helix bundle suffix domain-containing protein [Fimbriimonas sp.]